MKARIVPLLAVLVALVACASAAQRSGATADRLSGVSEPAPSSSPTSLLGSVTAATIPDSAFRVAAPILEAAAGPGPPLNQPSCAPSDVIASAQTRRIASGVAGVLEMVGAHCSLRITAGPTELLDSAGTQLALPLDRAVTLVNPAANQRPDVPLGIGTAGWGFTWRGSWCGPKAASVVIVLDANPSSPADSSATRIVAPLTGPAPLCQGHSAAVLVPGVPGGPTEATLAPPPEWAGLRATLTLPPTTDGHTLSSAVVQLQNITAVPIVMSPCADYALDIDNLTAGGSALLAGGGALRCPRSSQVVPAHGTIGYDLGPQTYDEGDPGGGATPGSTVTAHFAIAGIPTARATSTVK